MALVDLHPLEQEIKKLGIKMDTIAELLQQVLEALKENCDDRMDKTT